MAKVSRSREATVRTSVSITERAVGPGVSRASAAAGRALVSFAVDRPMSSLVTPVAGGVWVSTYLIPVLLEIKGAVIKAPPFGECGFIALGPWGWVLVDALSGSVVGHEKYRRACSSF